MSKAGYTLHANRNPVFPLCGRCSALLFLPAQALPSGRCLTVHSLEGAGKPSILHGDPRPWYRKADLPSDRMWLFSAMNGALGAGPGQAALGPRAGPAEEGAVSRACVSVTSPGMQRGGDVGHGEGFPKEETRGRQQRLRIGNGAGQGERSPLPAIMQGAPAVQVSQTSRPARRWGAAQDLTWGLIIRGSCTAGPGPRAPAGPVAGRWPPQPCHPSFHLSPEGAACLTWCE